jgi:hypothetical protein
MGKTNAERIADKIIELMADGRVKKSDWRFWIPRRIAADNSAPIVIVNAKHFADGINEAMADEEIGIAEHHYLGRD